MKLKKLEITGFKSFPEKASISFPPGISAVVGPNGCGKSNIVDALRWVMGEQSVKQLRGKAMEDVIFAGTNGHSPLNMAEVSLTLLNDNGSAPEELKDFSEINVTRRLYRSGESAYYLNKQPCRLKDVHNLFLGSGMGTRSYAVIQQGNIGAITDADPDQRRYFIEEAAGVTRYKNRKKEALRKVDATKQNLFRVSDIILEVSRQMSGLKRQAKKAEIYKKNQSRIQQLDVFLAAHHFNVLTTQIDEADALLKKLTDSDIAHSAELKKLDAAVEDIKLKRWQKNQLISDKKSQHHETQRRVDRAENDLAYLRKDIERLGQEVYGLESARTDLENNNLSILSEIKQAEQDIATTQAQIDDIKTRHHQEDEVRQEVGRQLSNLKQSMEARKKELLELSSKEAQYQNVYQHATNTKESLKRRLRLADEQEVLAQQKVTEINHQVAQAKDTLTRYQSRIGELNENIKGAESTLNETRDSLGQQVKHYHTLELERKTLQSRYTTLKKMEDNFEWYRDGVRAVMKAQADPATDSNEACPPKDGAILGLMADILEPQPTFEAAVEAVLGEALQYILVRDEQAAMDSIGYLQSTGAGRSGFVPVSTVKPMGNGEANTRMPDKRLLNYVTIKTGFEKVAASLLGHVVVAENLQEALSLYQANGFVKAVVTKQGDVVSTQGVMIGGSQDKLSGILQKKHEIKALKEKIAAMDVELAAAHDRQLELEKALRAAEIELQQLIEKKNTAVQKEIEAEKTLYRLTEDFKHAQHHLEVVRLEQEQLLGEESDVDEEISKFQSALQQMADKIKTKQLEVTEATRQIETVEGDMEEINQRLVDLKLKQTALNAKIENSTGSLRRLKDFQKDAIHRLQQLSEDIAVKKKKRAESEQKVDGYGRQLSEMYDTIKSLEADLETNEAEYDAISSKLKEMDSEISNIQSRREGTLQKIRLLEMEQSQRQIKRETVVTRVEERYHRTFAELKAIYMDAPPAEDREKIQALSPEQIEAELAKLRKRIQAIGDVNLGAIKEYEQYKERYDFLVTQRDDLNQAIEDLQRVIRKINRITQEKFMATLHQVNEKLKEVFPKLFSGGTATLVLTDPDKPLESGVEFMIHPPGKKLTRQSLLSGGEKALSAIAFIFSIFLIKPASFCLMDEIDAPLDDANVFRFNELVKTIGDKSQIVMITHNKRSMEFADTLFGITMEKKGISKVVSVNLERQQAA